MIITAGGERSNVAVAIERTDRTQGEPAISTGIAALDARLGGLVAGRHYLLQGSPGAGKTTASLQFIGAGLQAGEHCALVSQDDPEDIFLHADHIGLDLRSAVRDDRLVLLQFRMDFLRRYSRLMDPALVFGELLEMLTRDSEDPARLVIDSVAPFLEGGHVSSDLIDGLGDFLGTWDGTTYLTIPETIGERAQRRLYDRVINSAAGVFRLERVRGARRELAIAKLRQKARDTEPFAFVIEPGRGIVEEASGSTLDGLTPGQRRRILVLDPHDSVSSQFLTGIAESFDVQRYRSLERGFSEIASASYGALVLGLDPYQPNAMLDLAYSLRQSGNGAPIVFVAPREGLRSSTRARALRAGADDFITLDSGPVEVLERIGSASGRGHRSVARYSAMHPRQPTDPDGRLRLMDESEFRDALARTVAQPTPPLFGVITLEPATGSEGAWALLRDQVRLEDGDLVARIGDDGLAVYLSHVDSRTAESLVERIAEFHDGEVELLSYPADQDRLADRFGLPVDRTATGLRSDG